MLPVHVFIYSCLGLYVSPGIPVFRSIIFFCQIFQYCNAENKNTIKASTKIVFVFVYRILRLVFLLIDLEIVSSGPLTFFFFFWGRRVNKEITVIIEILLSCVLSAGKQMYIEVNVQWYKHFEMSEQFFVYWNVCV